MSATFSHFILLFPQLPSCMFQQYKSDSSMSKQTFCFAFLKNNRMPWRRKEGFGLGIIKWMRGARKTKEVIYEPFFLLQLVVVFFPEKFFYTLSLAQFLASIQFLYPFFLLVWSCSPKACWIEKGSELERCSIIGIPPGEIERAWFLRRPKTSDEESWVANHGPSFLAILPFSLASIPLSESKVPGVKGLRFRFSLLFSSIWNLLSIPCTAEPNWIGNLISKH